VLPLSFGLGVLTPRAKVKFNIGVSAADRPVDVPALFSLVYVVPPYDVSKKKSVSTSATPFTTG
jgi:hypothetical protein